MSSDPVIALFAGIGAGMWIFFQFSKRSTGGEMIKNLAPAALAGLVVFIFVLSLLSVIF